MQISSKNINKIGEIVKIKVFIIPAILKGSSIVSKPNPKMPIFLAKRVIKLKPIDKYPRVVKYDFSEKVK